MDLEQEKTPPQDDGSAKQPDSPKTRRTRRDRSPADRSVTDKQATTNGLTDARITEAPAMTEGSSENKTGQDHHQVEDKLAGERAIERMAEAGRRLADQERRALRPASEVTRKPAPPSARPQLPVLAQRTPRVSFTAFRRMPANMPIYAAAVCLAIGAGGLLGGQFGPSGDNVAADSERVERPVVARREVADKTRDEITGLRAELAALRANSEQLRQAETGKQASELKSLRATLDAQKAETAVLKAEIGARAERTEREASLKSEKVAERVDRLERRLSDTTPTATVAKTATPALTAVAEPQKAEKLEKLPIPGIVLRDVARGVALVETRRGLMEVMPGDVIPGAGRVETIEKHAGHWRVVTSNGTVDDAVD